MPDLVIHGIKPDTLKRLKQRAKQHGRSLQSEAKLALQHAADQSGDDLEAILAELDKRFAGRAFTSSVDLLREDRNR